MRQEAIRVTRENASDIASKLTDGTSAQDILDLSDYMLTASINVVLVQYIFDEDFIALSHIVSESMFYSNATTDLPLNDKTFVAVTQL